MQIIKSRGKEYEIPENIDELTPDQYEYFLMLYLTSGYRNPKGQIFIERWMAYLIGMDDYKILLPEYIAEIDAQLPLLGGFFVNGEPDLRTVRNLLPEYKGFKGPADGLSGFPFGKFVECLTELTGMGKAEREADYEACVDHIARVMYDIPEGVDVPYLLKFHAPRLFYNVWHMIQTGPVVINGEPIDFRILFRSFGESRPDDKTGWTGITFEVAEKGVFGTVPEVEATDMWAVLIYLYKCKFEYNYEKSKMK